MQSKIEAPGTQIMGFLPHHIWMLFGTQNRNICLPGPFAKPVGVKTNENGKAFQKMIEFLGSGKGPWTRRAEGKRRSHTRGIAAFYRCRKWSSLRVMLGLKKENGQENGSYLRFRV